MASFSRSFPLLLLVVTYAAAFFAVVAGQASSSSSGAHYRGRYVGPITAQKHKVSGEVYAVDSRTLHIRGFTYDGTGPDAFFWTGFTEHPSSQGVIIPNERGTKEVLGAYKNQDITISLPDGLTLRDIKWIAVWCRAYEVNFGDLYIPLNLDYPQPHVVGSLVGQQGVTSGPIVVVDAQTILVPDFTYDGQAPDLHFWVGRGVPGPQGVRVPDETGTDGALQKADKKTMVLSLPGDLTVFDVDYFGVWCRLYSIDFGHVRITPGLNVPPSLRMLGVAPQLAPLVPSPPSAPIPLLPSLSPATLISQHHHAPQPLVQDHQQIVQDYPPQSSDGALISAFPDQQYYMIVEDQVPNTYQDQNHLVTYQQDAQISHHPGLIYSPAAAATSTSTASHVGLGSNGFSTFTIRTSKGTQTSDVLY